MKKLLVIVSLFVFVGMSFRLFAKTSVRLDFDGDGKTDPTVRSGSFGQQDWWVMKSAGGISVVSWGFSSQPGGFADHPIHADYDGDGKTDYAIWRQPSTSPTDPIGLQCEFWILYSATGTYQAIPWGRSYNAAYIDQPVKGDYDGDGKDDVAIFRKQGTQVFWHILQSQDGYRVEQFGNGLDIPAPGDYDGDNKADLAIARENQGTNPQWDFYIKRSSDGNWIVQRFGSVLSDYVKTADYDGDGKTDIGVWGGKSQFATGFWSWIRSSDGQPVSVRWGFGELFDAPAQGDYDSDGKTDIAVYRVNTFSSCTEPNYFWIRGTQAGLMVIQLGSCHGHPISNY